MFCRKTKQQHTAAATSQTHTSVWGDTMGRLASRSIQTLALLLLATVVVLAMRYVNTVVIPLVLALMLAATFNPIMLWLRSRRVPPAAASLIVLFGIIAVLTGIGLMIVNSVKSQWHRLSQSAVDGLNQIVAALETLPFNTGTENADFVQFQQKVLEFFTSGQFSSGALAVGGAVGNFLASALLFIIILFFFLKDGKEIWEFLCRPFHGAQYERAMRVGKITIDTFGSYVRGTASVAALDAIGIGICLVVLQVPLALPLAVLVFILSFVPMVGAIVAGVIAGLVALVANGWVTALIIVGIAVLVNQVEGNMLQPVLMGRALQLHPLVILIAIAAGAVVAGILGMMLAVPLVAAVWGAIKVWDGPGKPAKWARKKTTT